MKTRIVKEYGEHGSTYRFKAQVQVWEDIPLGIDLKGQDTYETHKEYRAKGAIDRLLANKPSKKKEVITYPVAKIPLELDDSDTPSAAAVAAYWGQCGRG
jgi:hypothetical protein